MREIYIADSETDPFDGKTIPAPFIWGLTNGDDYHQFETTREFIMFVKDKPIIVYAHNGGKFDWHFILDELEPFTEILVISGRLSKFKIGECEFRDSMNILPLPLKAFKKDEFDYSLMSKAKRDIPANRRKIEKYLKNDCFYLHEIVMQFIETYGLQLTVAGAAVKQWEKITQTKAPKTGAHFYSSIAPYYYGGRVECFKTGMIDYDFKVIDINSAYPDAMMKLHPYGESYSVSESLPNSRAYIERSFITIDCICDGAFPFRAKNGLTFPNDGVRRVYNVTGWEFLAASDCGALHDWDILSVISFPDSIKFDKYINHFFQMKKDAKADGDKAGYIFAKLFLNSLYGKFGSNPEKYDEYMIIKPEHIEAAHVEDDYTFCAELGHMALVSRPLGEDKQRYYNVAVSASITGAVRAKMFRSIVACDGVMYCDTDSIACTSTGALELDPHELGAWDIEAECDSGGIAGKKLYAFHQKEGGYKTASKGVRLEAEQILKVANGEDAIYMPEAPSFSLKRGTNFISRKVRKTVV